MNLHNACQIMNSSMELHNKFIGLYNFIDGNTISNFGSQ